MGWFGRRWWMLAALAVGCTDDAPPQFEARCVALPRLPDPSRVVVEDVFGGVDLGGAVALVEHPTQARFYLVVKSGQIYTFTPDDTSPERVLDIEDALVIAGEAGLLDLELHPDFATNRYAYLSYNAPRDGDAMLSRISRVEFSADGL